MRKVILLMLAPLAGCLSLCQCGQESTGLDVVPMPAEQPDRTESLTGVRSHLSPHSVADLSNLVLRSNGAFTLGVFKLVSPQHTRFCVGIIPAGVGVSIAHAVKFASLESLAREVRNSGVEVAISSIRNDWFDDRPTDDSVPMELSTIELGELARLLQDYEVSGNGLIRSDRRLFDE
jgi:hypothetical protein